MDFPWTRHYQRYEYLMGCGYVKDKDVIEVGCGSCVGTYKIATEAKHVLGIDFDLPDASVIVQGGLAVASVPAEVVYNRAIFSKTSVQDLSKSADRNKADVCVAIEVLEHNRYPKQFLKAVSKLCDYAFITTPLAAKTGKTDNKFHFKEYSNQDFRKLLEQFFTIKKMAFQLSDLRIVNKAKPKGSSMKEDHVVQMAYCEVKR